MSEAFPIIKPTKENTYAGFALEIDGLCAVAETRIFQALLERFDDYKIFLETESKHIYTKKKIQKLFKDGILDLTSQSPLIDEILCMVHMAGCCELIKGTSLDVSTLKRINAEALAKTIFDYHKDAHYALDFTLHSMDAVRTMHILRILGLVTRQVNDTHQLSLGAADGMKDIRSIHLIPSLKKTLNLKDNNQDNLYKFDVIETHAKSAIIVDGDPTRKEAYEQWNNSEQNVLAINQDSMETLQKLPEIMQDNQLPPRNLVIILRLEHRMIPSVKTFFKLLKDSIADTSDLVITIGSGQSMDDFDGRTSIIKNMFSELVNLGMKPVIIKLHGHGSLEEQYMSPKFGMPAITTYQILHCKVKRKLLEKI